MLRAKSEAALKKGNGKLAPPYLARKSSKASGGVRDYHWTAANVFYLLHTPNATLP